jgi:hypothetical protein
MMEASLSEVSTHRSDYGASIRAAARGLWLTTPPGAAGDRVVVLSYSQFYDSLITTIRHGLPLAFAEGMRKVGVSPDEMTGEERVMLDRAIASEEGHIEGFARFIEDHAKALKGKWGAVANRAKMWIIRYDDLVHRAMMMAGKNQKLRWRLHLKRVTKVSCKDCLRLDGRVYRAKTWEKWDVRPQHFALACGGFLCGCGFEVVGLDVRCTPGRPPKLSGQ